jgi:hypothetical protein
VASPEVELRVGDRAIGAVRLLEQGGPEYRDVELDGLGGAVDDQERDQAGVALRNGFHVHVSQFRGADDAAAWKNASAPVSCL